MSKAKVFVTCSCCRGSGRVELNGAYLDTLRRLKKLGGERTAAELGRDMNVQPTAMSNRLAALERFGLVASRRYGRKRLFTVKED